MNDTEKHLIKVLSRLVEHDRKYLNFLQSGVRVSESKDDGPYKDVTEKTIEERKARIANLEGLLAKLQSR